MKELGKDLLKVATIGMAYGVTLGLTYVGGLKLAEFITDKIEEHKDKKKNKKGSK